MAHNDPFGNNTPNENPAGAGAFAFNLRFPGQYFDAETGKHYNYFRDYDPGIGRYIQSDPIGLMGGLNSFSYVSSNPLVFIDDLGLLNWGYGGARYDTNLGTGSTYRPYPGAVGVPIPSNVGGATSIDWDISSECECVNGSYRLKEFSVSLHTNVSLRKSYPGGKDQAEWSVRAEGDHVADIGSWQGGDGRGTAEAAEQNNKRRSFGSREECERVTAGNLNTALTTSFQAAARKSRATWDITGRHTYSNPRRRP